MKKKNIIGLMAAVVTAANIATTGVYAGVIDDFDGNINRITETKYYTVVSINFEDEENNLSMKKTSDVITAKYDTEAAVNVMEEYEEELDAFAKEHYESYEVVTELIGISYEAHDEIINPKDENFVIIGDSWDDSYAVQGTVTIKTVLEKTYKYEVTLKDAVLKSDEENKEEKTEYAIVEGANQEYTIGQEKEVTIKCDGEFAKFTGIGIDGKELDETNYTAKEGSTIVTFENKYLDTLKAGKHKVTFMYEDGEVSTDMTIKEQVVEKEEDKKDVVVDDTKVETTEENLEEIPNTGDGFVSTLMIAIASLFGITLTKKRIVKE